MYWSVEPKVIVMERVRGMDKFQVLFKSKFKVMVKFMVLVIFMDRFMVMDIVMVMEVVMICVLSMTLRMNGPSSWTRNFSWAYSTTFAGYSMSWTSNCWISSSSEGSERSESWKEEDIES